MTLFRATVLDTPDEPVRRRDAARRGGLRACSSSDGVIAARGDFADAARRAPRRATSSTCASGMLLPGLVDTHVHFPQVRVIGGLGMPLLDWLDQCALPEEVPAGRRRRTRVAWPGTSSPGCVDAGTTTALVFGSHFALGRGRAVRRRPTCGACASPPGLVVSDRVLPEPLLTTPERAYDESRALAAALARQGPAPVCRDAALLALGQRRDARVLRRDRSRTSRGRGSPRTSTRTPPRSPRSAGCSTGRALRRHLRPARPGRAARSVLAHNVHADRRRARRCSPRGAPRSRTARRSNSALGSGLFPLRRHVEAGVRVALGSDVGAGTGFSLLKEGLQAYFMQQLLGDRGPARSPRRTCSTCAPRAGADALGPGRRGRRPVGGQAVRRGLAAARGRRPARRRPRQRQVGRRRPGQGVRARRRPPTSPASGSAATRSPPVAGGCPARQSATDSR